MERDIQAALASCGSFGMRIDRRGVWYHEGTPIGRPALVKLFASVLQRDEAGQFWLVTPYERGVIEVEDAPFLAVELVVDNGAEGPVLRFRTNIDHWVTLDAEHPLRVETNGSENEPRPYLTVRPGIEALVTRSVFYQLAELGSLDRATGAFGVSSAGVFFPLGTLED